MKERGVLFGLGAALKGVRKKSLRLEESKGELMALNFLRLNRRGLLDLIEG
jgi:hypothetical protein